jgi:hypothetical protein
MNDETPNSEPGGGPATAVDAANEQPTTAISAAISGRQMLCMNVKRLANM